MKGWPACPCLDWMNVGEMHACGSACRHRQGGGMTHAQGNKRRAQAALGSQQGANRREHEEETTWCQALRVGFSSLSSREGRDAVGFEPRTQRSGVRHLTHLAHASTRGGAPSSPHRPVLAGRPAAMTDGLTDLAMIPSSLPLVSRCPVCCCASHPRSDACVKWPQWDWLLGARDDEAPVIKRGVGGLSGPNPTHMCVYSRCCMPTSARHDARRSLTSSETKTNQPTGRETDEDEPGSRAQARRPRARRRRR